MKDFKVGDATMIFHAGDTVRFKGGWGRSGGFIMHDDGLYTVTRVEFGKEDTCYIYRIEGNSWRGEFEISIDQLDLVERVL